MSLRRAVRRRVSLASEIEGFAAGLVGTFVRSSDGMVCYAMV